MEKVKHNIKQPKNVAARAFWGLFFLGAAALVLLTSFEVIPMSINIGIMTGLVAIAAVALGFIFKKLWFIGFMVIAAGLMVASSAGLVMDFSGQQRGMIFVAAGLIGVAFHVMFRKKYGIGDGEWRIDEGEGNDISASFTGVSKQITDKEFVGAKLSCNFGAIKAHFDKTKLKGKKATICVENHFGGVELFLPKSWAVDNQMDLVMGGVEEKNQPTLVADSPQIALIGTVKCGGVVITYV